MFSGLRAKDFESDNWPFIAPAGSTASPLPVLDNSVFGYAADLNDVGLIVCELHIWKKRQPDFEPCCGKNGQAIDLSKLVSLVRPERIENAAETNNTGLTSVGCRI